MTKLTIIRLLNEQFNISRLNQGRIDVNINTNIIDNIEIKMIKFHDVTNIIMILF